MAEHGDLLSQTFVDVADTLVAEFDIVEFLTLVASRCVELFDLAAAGMFLVGPDGGVSVAASSDHAAGLLELLELQYGEGPCLDASHSGLAVRCDDLHAGADRWPRFAPEALARGYGSVYALPMRLRDKVIGALNLVRADSGGLGSDELVVAQALADVATIGILQHRAALEQQLLAEQLQYALTSRVVVEQAKGCVAEFGAIDMDASFAALRQYARDHNERLVEVARAVVKRALPAEAVLRGRGAGRSRRTSP